MSAALTDAEMPSDNLATLIAIGLLAYASADIAHHVLGHGGACFALGGHVISLSSIFVDCTVRNYFADMAGPFANLAVGLIALAAARRAKNASTSLFLSLAAGFNLLWFALQFLSSIATRTDDFAWLTFQAGAAVRYGLIAFGALLYVIFIRLASAAMADFAKPATRLRRVVWIAWLTAGIFACLTALFDHHPAAALLHHAAPQSFILSIGLLFTPRGAARLSSANAPPVGFSVAWIAAALAIAAASIAFLGPGFSV
jgi:hypothetical protein